MPGRVEARHRHAEDAAARPSDRRVDLPAHAELGRSAVRGAVPHRGRAPLRRGRARHQAARLDPGEPGQRRSDERPADDGLRRPAAAAVRVDDAALQAGSARAAGLAEHVRDPNDECGSALVGRQRRRHIETSFTTTGCKPPQFAPTFRAGVENPVAGSSSPLHVALSRTDDDSGVQVGSRSTRRRACSLASRTRSSARTARPTRGTARRARSSVMRPWAQASAATRSS